MKNLLRKALLLFLSLTFILSFTACDTFETISGTDFDASGYVKCLLDLRHYNETKKYLELTDSTQEESVETYEEWLNNEVNYFCNYAGIQTDKISDEVYDQLHTFIKSVFEKAKYDVKKAMKTDSGYAVEVIVSPVNIFVESYDSIDEYVNLFLEKYADYDFQNSSTEIEDEYANGILEILNSFLPTVGYEEDKSIIVQVTQDEDNLYYVNDTDYGHLIDLIITYK